MNLNFVFLLLILMISVLSAHPSWIKKIQSEKSAKLHKRMAKIRQSNHDFLKNDKEPVFEPKKTSPIFNFDQKRMLLSKRRFSPEKRWMKKTEPTNFGMRISQFRRTPKRQTQTNVRLVNERHLSDNNVNDENNNLHKFNHRKIVTQTYRNLNNQLNRMKLGLENKLKNGGLSEDKIGVIFKHFGNKNRRNLI